MGDQTAILNWRRWDEDVTLSGQPTEAQLADLAAEGVTDVYNLGPHSNEGALPDEEGTVTKLGLRYHYLPVDFENPTEADYSSFCETLERLRGTRLHVHCIYNARVSAFFYRYAKDGRGGTPDVAFALMDSIWRPGGVWATFVDDKLSTELPNRYAGYEYEFVAEG